MANTKSAIKAARQSVRNAARNSTTISRLKTLRKSFAQAAEKGDTEAAKAAGIAYASAVDKACKKGIVHKNAASHVKSNVAKFAQVKKA